MKRSASILHLIRTAAFGLLVLAAPTACKTANPANKSSAAAAPSDLYKDMIGTWVHVGSPGRVYEAPASGGRLKFRTGSHWTLTVVNSDTGLVTENFGGTYTLNGDEYIETQDHATPMWMHDNGKSFRFKVVVEGDTMTQFGVGNPYTEVWKRLK